MVLSSQHIFFTLALSTICILFLFTLVRTTPGGARLFRDFCEASRSPALAALLLTFQFAFGLSTITSEGGESSLLDVYTHHLDSLCFVTIIIAIVFSWLKPLTTSNSRPLARA